MDNKKPEKYSKWWVFTPAPFGAAALYVLFTPGFGLDDAIVIVASIVLFIVAAAWVAADEMN